MSRAKWKGIFITLIKNNKKKYKLKTLTKNSKIAPNFLDQTFDVFNGKEYSKLTINQDMIGHKVGEFVFTRKKFSFKKKSKKK